MDATPAPAFERFITRRERLLRRYDEVHTALEAWISAHRSAGIPMAELAHFEGLLGERRSLLEELMDADDEMLDAVLIQNGLARTESRIVR
jgi:hypothetical protein